MAHGKSIKSDPIPIPIENENGNDTAALQELNRLTRQLRLMENDKKAYLEESNAAINHQKNIIKALADECNKIEAEINVYKEKKNEERDSENINKITKLFKEYQSLKNNYNNEVELLKETSKKLESVSEKMTHLKSRVEMKEAEEASINELKNKIFIAKRKLETATAKFDGVVSENAELRSKIDESLLENLSILRKCTEIENEVEKGRKEIDEIVDQATLAYEQREEAVAKTNALTERNLKERKQFTLEMSELNRVTRHEEKLLEFMSTKNKDRQFLETDQERLSRLEMAKEKISDEALEVYRESFEQLLNEKSPTLAHLPIEFKDLYKNNERRFAYINELNDHMERLDGEILALREDIRMSEFKTTERNKIQNEIILKQEVELNLAREEYEKVHAEYNSSTELMKKIVELIKNLFIITDYDGNITALELLGRSQSISNENAMLYMNILEERISDVFKMIKKEERGRVISISEEETAMNLKSPRASSRAGSVASSMRPKILISETRSNLAKQKNSDEDVYFDIVDAEEDPLGYRHMRGRVMEFSKSSTLTNGDDSDDGGSSSFIRNHLSMADVGTLSRMCGPFPDNKMLKECKFFLALREGDVEYCRNVIKQNGFDVDFTYNGMPAVMIAASASNEYKGYELVKLLIENGCSINKSDFRGYTALMTSIEQGYEQIAILLIEYYSNVNLINDRGLSPLHLAVNANSFLPGVVHNLIMHGADVSRKNYDGQTPLFFARRYEIAQQLITNGASIHEYDRRGIGVLAHLLFDEKCEYKTIKYLIKKGACACAKAYRVQPDERSNNFQSVLSAPIHHLVSSSFRWKWKCLNLMLKSGCDVNFKTASEQRSILHLAVLKNDLNSVLILLRAGAEPNTVDGLNLSPLYYAINGYSKKIVFALVSAGARTNEENLLDNFPSRLDLSETEAECLRIKLKNPMSLMEISRISCWKHFGPHISDWISTNTDQLPSNLSQYINLGLEY